VRKALIVFGTRPEAIKLYPVIKIFKESKTWDTITLSTGQHQLLLDEIVSDLDIHVDVKMEPKASGALEMFPYLYDRMSVLCSLYKPDVIIVQGDTFSAYIGALVGFLNRVPVAHVEAGLRTFDWNNPFPEEGLRQMISCVASYNYCPTVQSMKNLQGAMGSRLMVGNTVIDTLLDKSKDAVKKNQLLVTMHRRENWGQPIENVAKAIRLFLEENSNWSVVWPVHPNPIVRKAVIKYLDGKVNKPMKYTDFIKAMAQSKIIITDSGGVQEEASIFNIPVLVARETTERPEAVEMGYATIVGTDTKKMYDELNKAMKWKAKTINNNLFGDGHAAEKIFDDLCQKIK